MSVSIFLITFFILPAVTSPLPFLNHITHFNLNETLSILAETQIVFLSRALLMLFFPANSAYDFSGGGCIE